MTNPLVAARVDSTQWNDGLPVLDAGFDCVDAIARGDWIEGSINGAVVGLDALGAVIDPLGTALTGVAAWILDHVEPLPSMLDSLAGDPDAVAAAAMTWSNVADALRGAAGDYEGVVSADVSAMRGAGIDAYRGYAEGEAWTLRALATIADGTGAGVALAGQIVAGVRTLVRDVLAEFAGRLVAWAAQLAASFGLATPLVVAQVTRAVADTATTVARFLRNLTSSLGRLGDLLRTLKGQLDDAGRLVRRMATASESSPYFRDFSNLDELKAHLRLKAPVVGAQEGTRYDDSPVFR